MSNSFFGTYVVFVLTGKAQNSQLGWGVLVKMVTQDRYKLPDVFFRAGYRCGYNILVEGIICILEWYCWEYYLVSVRLLLVQLAWTFFPDELMISDHKMEGETASCISRRTGFLKNVCVYADKSSVSLPVITNIWTGLWLSDDITLLNVW
jgi:hypothetical protein